MSLDDMQENASKATLLLKSMANETRLMILCQLVDGEKSVSEMHKNIPLSQSALSQHLAILRRERLVNTSREAQSVFYRLASDDVRAVIQTLYGIYCAPGD
ncbi:ArsR/SmtB family transcription factor [Hyphobacterium lacteum]